MDAVHAGVRWEVVSHNLMKTEYTYEIIDVEMMDESVLDDIAELLARVILEQMKEEVGPDESP